MCAGVAGQMTLTCRSGDGSAVRRIRAWAEKYSRQPLDYGSAYWTVVQEHIESF